MLSSVPCGLKLVTRLREVALVVISIVICLAVISEPYGWLRRKNDARSCDDDTDVTIVKCLTTLIQGHADNRGTTNGVHILLTNTPCLSLTIVVRILRTKQRVLDSSLNRLSGLNATLIQIGQLILVSQTIFLHLSSGQDSVLTSSRGVVSLNQFREIQRVVPVHRVLRSESGSLLDSCHQVSLVICSSVQSALAAVCVQNTSLHISLMLVGKTELLDGVANDSSVVRSNSGILVTLSQSQLSSEDSHLAVIGIGVNHLHLIRISSLQVDLQDTGLRSPVVSSDRFVAEQTCFSTLIRATGHVRFVVRQNLNLLHLRQVSA